MHIFFANNFSVHVLGAQRAIDAYKPVLLHLIYNTCSLFFFAEKEQQEAIEHIDEVQNEIDR